MLRDATIYDIKQINELGELLHKNFAKVFNIHEMLEDKISKVIVYEKNNKVVGFIIATHLYETCDILSVVVDKNYRKQKIASNLLAYLMSDLSDTVKLFTLEVATKNEAALKLYENFEFAKVHIRKNYYNDDDAYLMARKC